MSSSAVRLESAHLLTSLDELTSDELTAISAWVLEKARYLYSLRKNHGTALLLYSRTVNVYV